MKGWFRGRRETQERRDELLSAYLDGQLSVAERERLEERLATDAALQAELEALRRTVAWVRELPPAPLPRNFILPPTIEARPRPTPAARPRRAEPALGHGPSATEGRVSASTHPRAYQTSLAAFIAALFDFSVSMIVMKSSQEIRTPCFLVLLPLHQTRPAWVK